MTTVTAEKQMRAFYEFLGRQLATGCTPATPEASVDAFHQYQDELRRFTTGTSEAVRQSNAGETRPLDVELLMKRVQSRLDEQERRKGA